MQVNAHLTPQACLSRCASLGFAYAGLEVRRLLRAVVVLLTLSAKYGKECHCDNAVHASTKRAAKECSMKCG